MRIHIYISSIIVFFFCINTYGRTTNKHLNIADSLIRIGNTHEAIDLLLPLEVSFEDESTVDKFFYYGLLSLCYLSNNDTLSAIPYLEKKAKYNSCDIEDFYCLANIFVSEYPDRYKAEKYTRRSLIRINELNIMGYNADYSAEQLSRLYYLMGTLECRKNNKLFAKQCLNELHEIKSKNKENRIIWLSEDINNLSDAETNSIDDRINILHKNKYVELATHDKTEYTKEYVDVLANTVPFDMESYLEGILYLEDKNTIQDIYQSKFLLEEAARIINKNKEYWKHSPQLCELYLRLGRLDFYLKKYESSVIWFILALQNSYQLQEKNEIMMQAYGGIAQNYIEIGNTFKAHMYADELFETIVESLEYSNQQLNNIVLSQLGIYAYVLSQLHKYELAGEIFDFVINTVPENSNIYKYACNNYATMLYLQGNHDKGLYYYELIKNKFPTTQTISNLALAYIGSNKKDKASIIFEEYYNSCIIDFINYIADFNECEWERLWEKEGTMFYITSNYCAYGIADNKSLELGYNSTLLSKTLPLIFKSILPQLIYESNDDSVKALYEKYKYLKEQLSQQGNQSIEDVHNKIYFTEDSLIHSISNIEAMLINHIPKFNDIYHSLNDDEVAIEFTRYLDLSSPLIGYQYAAYIISKDYDCPQFIILASENELTNYIYNKFEDPYSINQLYSENKIYKYIWEKLNPYIQNKKNIYFTPINRLSYINHSIIKNENDLILGDQYNIIRVSSTSQIPLVKQSQEKYENAVLYGDINYCVSISKMQEKSDFYKYPSKNKQNNDEFIANDSTRSGWNELKYSKSEIESIHNLFLEKQISSSIFIGDAANEESFKSLDYIAPDIIHLATHSFSYLEDDDKVNRDKINVLSTYTLSDVLMAWSGLLFAGANNTWNGELGIDSIEDGILTAEEISRLHLENTKLVVLSSCDGGHGYLDEFGNVLGLQKAFKQAGVGTVIMSLWKVADEPTALLMTYFYEELLDGTEKHEALKIAMAKVRETYPDPYYWGAFVILD